jgi:hypothetical protein
MGDLRLRVGRASFFFVRGHTSHSSGATLRGLFTVRVLAFMGIMVVLSLLVKASRNGNAGCNTPYLRVDFAHPQT